MCLRICLGLLHFTTPLEHACTKDHTVKKKTKPFTFLFDNTSLFFLRFTSV